MLIAHFWGRKKGLWSPHKHYSPIIGNRDVFFLIEKHSTKIQESLTCSNPGIEVPDKNALTSVSASLGLCKGTSCPAPLTETKLSPAYSWVHPPTCLPHIISLP